MKPSFLLLCLSLPLSAVAAPAEAPTDNPTAYTAMRLVGKQLGGDSLSRIVEINGRDGVPQPFLWKVVVKNKEGVQEVEVAGGKIVNQHTLDRAPAAALPPIHLQDLNLDSSGAFEAADTQARKVRLRFDSVQYALRAGDGGKPVWTLDLMDLEGAKVGMMRVAAADGATLSIDGRLADNSVFSGPSHPASSANLPPPPPNSPAEPPTMVVTDDDDSGGFFTRTGRTLDHTNDTVKRNLDRTNETVKRNLRKASSRVQRFFHIGGGDDGGNPPPE